MKEMISLLTCVAFFSWLSTPEQGNNQQDQGNSEGIGILQPRISSSSYHTMREGLHNSLIRFERKKRGRVAFLGGSITYNGGWRDSICNYLEERFPETDFEFIAAGIPSMGTTPGAFRLERDVLKNGPVDLLFEEAAVNDATNGRTSDEQIRAMEGIVRHARIHNPAVDIVIMHFVDPGKMKAYRNGKTPRVIQNHEMVAAHYQIPTINLAKEVTDRIDAGEFTWEDDFINLHPSPFGQSIYYRSIKVFLEKAWSLSHSKEAKVKLHPVPEKLDPACYDRGVLRHLKDIPCPAGWTYVANWQPVDSKGTRANYTNVPMLIGKEPGKILEFRFEGTAAGIAVAAGPDAGTIEYSLDGGPWQRKDLFTKWSKNLHLPWYYTLASGLDEGAHVLKIRISKQKNPASTGHACRIRYIYINGLK